MVAATAHLRQPSESLQKARGEIREGNYLLSDRFVQELKISYCFNKRLIEALTGIDDVVSLEEVAKAIDMCRSSAAEDLICIEELLVSLGAKVECKDDASNALYFSELEHFISFSQQRTILNDIQILRFIQRANHINITGFLSMKMLSLWLAFQEELDVLNVMLQRKRNNDTIISAVSQIVVK